MSSKYDTYLYEHIRNVNKGLNYIQKNIPELVDENKLGMSIIKLKAQFRNHDKSKYSKDEYKAYDEYFYGNKTAEVIKDFNYAWLHHIHSNPHHWQYWILFNDDDGDMFLEIPYNYILEMICDWWAFSWQKENLFEIFDWYEKHKSKIKVNPKTKSIVENILEKIKESLQSAEK